jgi:hypothetical protein
MANTLPCGRCALYHPIMKPLRKKEGGFKDLKRGHCLDRTVYASNKPGKPVYPKKAKVRELPFGRHQVALVRVEQVVPHCTAAKEKRDVQR